MEYSDAKLTKLLGVHQKHDITYTCVSPSHQGYVKEIQNIGALVITYFATGEELNLPIITLLGVLPLE
jgi:hypothetical protein